MAGRLAKDSAQGGKGSKKSVNLTSEDKARIAGLMATWRLGNKNAVVNRSLQVLGDVVDHLLSGGDVMVIPKAAAQIGDATSCGIMAAGQA